MTVVSVKAGAVPDVLSVGLSDGSSFLVRLSFLDSSASLPRVGSELSEAALSDCRRAALGYSAELAALRLIALREHSRYLLSMKLRKRDCSEASIKLALDRLESLGLLSDERFASSWVRSRVASKCEGSSKLLAGLLSRGVSREVGLRAVQAAFEGEAELSALRRLVSKMGYAGRLDDLLRDDKSLRSLRSRGFSMKSIKTAFCSDND